MRPRSQALEAKARVLKNRAAHSHLSMRIKVSTRSRYGKRAQKLRPQFLVCQDGPITDLVLLHLIDGGVGLVHGEGFDLCLDAVAGSNTHHFADTAGAANGA